MKNENSKKKGRIIVIGSGRMGKIRAGIIYANPRLEIIGIVDLNLKSAQELADTYSTRAYGCIEGAIQHYQCQGDQNSIDGIVISTPTFTHQKIVLEVKKHDLKIPVFTEKPVDETEDAIRSVFEVCKESGITLCCGFQRRFDDTYVTVANAVKEGKIGHPVSANIFFADHPCPPIQFLIDGGDIFMDLSAHDLDYIRWVLNDEVKSVYATGSSSVKKLEEVGVHDNATMLMTFMKGTVVTLTLSRSACYGYDQRCEIFGSEGLASVGNEFANSSIISDSNGAHCPKLKHSFPERFHQAFSSEIDAFADTILFDVPWSITENDCIAVQRIADAAKKSCDLNQVVKL